MMKYIRTAVFGILFFFFTMMLFFGSIFVWMYVVVFDRKRRLAMQWYSSFWSKSIFRLNPWWRVDIRGLENIDRSKTYLFLSNHQAMLDIPLLFYVPMNFRWVSKREMYRVPFFGWVLWMRDDVGIERGGAAGAKKMITKCSEFMKQGTSVFLFPEGTRSKTGKIGAFHIGAFLLAKKSKMPIIPVAINGTFDAVGKETGITGNHIFTVSVLPEITAEQVRALNIEELAALSEKTIKEEYNKICQTK